ncbi:hypothetical protein HNQ02_001164 [Flavobacterium sp. 7E]|uniref:glycosyltransferase n=1 Tax=Flavobacterium sp. 7E TaxID=2735898 RepID=UPI00156EDD66|nr:glycosyltransferase [Flavobacterium sp. 7E]NRS88250.1 hypothetical protein [Flavobacterium sp. 7E]
MIIGSIIIINYNTAKITLQALESIKINIQNIKNFEIILIDNASNEVDYYELKRGVENLNLDNIQLIKSKFNLGFGGGNMLGVQYAIGEYYIFMNSDVLLKNNSPLEMIEFLKKNKNTSIVGCQAVTEKNEKFKAFDYELSLTNELFSNSTLQFLNKKKYTSRMVSATEPLQVDSVVGSLFTCVANDFDLVGGFDTNIFLYYEEKDLAFRIKKYLKKNIFLLPLTQYIHLKGRSSGSSQKMKNELKISQFYAIQKNLGSLKYIIFYIISLALFLIKSPFNKKNRAYLSLLLKGISTSQSIKHIQNK